jgi:hypothetical protein
MSYIFRRALLASHPLRPVQCTRIVAPVVMQPIASPARRNYAAHQAEESYDAFNERYLSDLICPFLAFDGSYSIAFGAYADGRYEKFFYGANDKFEVQRGLNNVFAYDLVPSVKVCEAALRACRRGNAQ